MYFFASDVHLGAGTPEQARSTEARFIAWLESLEQNTQCEGLVLCGDIFDFWFEYKCVVPKGFSKVLSLFSRLTSRGVKILFMTGNHDLWMWDYLQQECGVEILRTPQSVTLGEKKVFVAHGDNLNVGVDWKVRVMNAMFRSHTARVLFSWLVHPDLAMSFGQWWSAKSRKSHGDKPRIDGARAAFLKYVELRECEEHNDYYVFGHLHHLEHLQNQNYDIVFLNDWSREPYVAILDNSGDISVQQVK